MIGVIFRNMLVALMFIYIASIVFFLVQAIIENIRDRRAYRKSKKDRKGKTTIYKKVYLTREDELTPSDKTIDDLILESLKGEKK